MPLAYSTRRYSGSGESAPPCLMRVNFKKVVIVLRWQNTHRRIRFLNLVELVAGDIGVAKHVHLDDSKDQSEYA